MSNLQYIEPPPTGDEETDNLFPMLHAHGAVITVVMAAPNGRIVGEVMRGSLIHKVMLNNHYIEVKDVQQ